MLNNLAKVIIPCFLCGFMVTGEASQINPVKINQAAILQNTLGLCPAALRAAISGYEWALHHTKVLKPNILTIIDFNLPSYKKRLWVINLKDSQPVMNLYTTQGKGSGLVYAQRFSNVWHTNETSLGVYKVITTYQGEHGLSEQLEGLEKGINNNAYKRDIVVHPAWYASPAFIQSHHRAGRSWGCFALDPAASHKFILLTHGGSVLFAYAAAEKHDSNLM